MVIFDVMAPVVLFLAGLILISCFYGRFLLANHQDAVAFLFGTTAKNNAISIALAFSVFGPEATMANAIAGPMVQLPLMIICSRFAL